MKKFLGILVFMIINSFFLSCKDEYTLCTLTKNVNFRAGFYERIGGSDVAKVAPNFTLSLLNGGTVFNNQVNLRDFSIPLNPQTDSIKYIVTLSSAAPADTITVVYATSSTNLSAECGAIFTHTVSKFYSTNHTIDSVRIVNAAVNNSGLENARIYFQ